MVILGKTASGKDTIVRKLCEKGFKKVVTYTTRPMRKGEKEGVTYHYISEKEFKQKIFDGFFAEWKVYSTVAGDWYYGVSKESLENMDDKSVIILTPQGYMDICRELKHHLKSIYISADIETIEQRLKLRGDDEKEARRRIEKDNKDFEFVDLCVDVVIENNFNQNLNELVEKILLSTNK